MEDVAEYYDRLIEEGNDPVLDPPALRAYMDRWDGQLFLDLLELDSSQRVLEIGCGTGRLSVRVAPFVKSFCGIDRSPKTVETARKHLPFSHVTLLCADFLNVSFEHPFDLIYSSLTFMHIKEKSVAVGAVRSLLAKGGRFVLSIDKCQASRIDHGDYGIDIYPDTPQTMLSLFREHGLKTVAIRETDAAYLLVAIG